MERFNLVLICAYKKRPIKSGILTGRDDNANTREMDTVLFRFHHLWLKKHEHFLYIKKKEEKKNRK
jgi:hypothetical protein